MSEYVLAKLKVYLRCCHFERKEIYELADKTCRINAEKYGEDLGHASLSIPMRTSMKDIE
jgi:hypothetical protein